MQALLLLFLWPRVLADEIIWFAFVETRHHGVIENARVVFGHMPECALIRRVSGFV